MIKLICVGKIKEQYIKEGTAEFLKRLQAFTKLEVIELKDSTLEKEAQEIVSKLKNETVFLLDEHGREYESIDFAEFLKKERDNEKDIVFIIGGPNGLHDSLKAKYRSIALSRMTFTHEMARLFFLEQLYRAFSILKNMPYHR